MQSSFFEHTQRIWPLRNSTLITLVQAPWSTSGATSHSTFVTLWSVLCMVITRMLNRPDHFSSLLKLSTEFQSRWHHNVLLCLARPRQSPLLLPLQLSLFSALFTLLQSHWSPHCSWITTSILLPSDPCAYSFPLSVVLQNLLSSVKPLPKFDH